MIKKLTPLGLLALLAMTGFILGFPICLFRSVTGIPCPGCGLTRSAIALFSGKVDASLMFHPLIFALMVGVPIVLFSKSKLIVVSVGAFTILLLLGVWLFRVFSGTYV